MRQYKGNVKNVKCQFKRHSPGQNQEDCVVTSLVQLFPQDDISSQFHRGVTETEFDDCNNQQRHNKLPKPYAEEQIGTAGGREVI